MRPRGSVRGSNEHHEPIGRQNGLRHRGSHPRERMGGERLQAAMSREIGGDHRPDQLAGSNASKPRQF